MDIQLTPEEEALIQQAIRAAATAIEKRRAEAREALFWYLEHWYNRERRHSSLGYLSPAQYKQQLANRRRAA